MLFDQQKWTDDHPEQPEGYLVFPSSKVSAFLSHILADCMARSSKDPHGAVKSARKALRHLRACQAGIPDDEAKFPSQPYIAGVTSRAKAATAEARQWLVAVCWQSYWQVMHLRSHERCMLVVRKLILAALPAP